MRIVIRIMTDTDRREREAITKRCREIHARGECPTCLQLQGQDVYPGSSARTYYEDERVVCLLETYPRGAGHTIIISREHYEDVSEMPIDLGCHVVKVQRAAILALKEILGAEKVYLVTMCSGRNHLHFQLIPRLEGDPIGGKVFSLERGVLSDFEEARVALERRVREILEAF